MTLRFRPGHRLGRIVTLSLGILFIAGIAGFAWFVRTAQRTSAVPAHADGIVALTGGADRVSAAFHLLAEGRADHMLVTGIGGGAVLHELIPGDRKVDWYARGVGGAAAGEIKGISAGRQKTEELNIRPAGIAPARISLRDVADRVTLGRGAASTHGNAAETAAWASANDIHSIILVTAFYHMPRAMLEMRRALPHLIFYPAPVFPVETMALTTRLRLLTEEYLKYLGTLAGLPSLAPRPHPMLTVAVASAHHT